MNRIEIKQPHRGRQPKCPAIDKGVEKKIRLNLCVNSVQAITNQNDATQEDLAENHLSQRNFKGNSQENQTDDLLTC